MRLRCADRDSGPWVKPHAEALPMWQDLGTVLRKEGA